MAPSDSHNRKSYPAPRALGEELEVMRMIWALENSVRHLSRVMHSHLGITGPQRLVLRVVGRRPGVSAGALAEFLHLDSSTLSGHLNHLEELGFVTRTPDTDDARRTSVSLTAEGRRRDVRMPGTLEAAVEATLVDTTPAQLAEVERFLMRLDEEMRRQADATSLVRKVAKKQPKARRGGSAGGRSSPVSRR